MVREPAPERRADHGREPEYAAQEPLPPAALGGRVQISDHRERVRENGPSAQALDRAEEDELEHVLRYAREDRADQEQNDRREDEGLAPVDIGELAVDRNHDSRSKEVRGD